MTCGAPGHDTNGRYLCLRHGGVPSADFVAALVGGAALEPAPDPTADTVPLPPPEALKIPEQRRLDTGFDIGLGDGDEDDDDGDDVIDDRPPAALRILTWILLTVTAVHIVLLVVDVLVLRREDAVLRQYAIEEDYLQATGAQAVFALVDRVGSAVGVALWVTLLMFAVWFGAVGRVADKLGRDRRVVLRHWTYIGWRLALIPLVVYLFAEAARDETRPSERFAFVEDALAVNHTAIMFTSLRIVMLALLAGFVVVVWRRLSPPPREDTLPF
ncbi:hypothetical protein [Dactylosporangium sp. NPDC051541]|uniref:hypothetical protein n=1 Tax=Dactylosporangium sp. NPDC051541 TaxID=3363977 RepID=UPI0037921BFF